MYAAIQQLDFLIEQRVEHKAVKHCLSKYGRPVEPTMLAVQAPALAEDGVRVAYWSNAAKEAAGIRTATSIGKYVKRFWPDLPDHTIRDIGALFGPDELIVTTDMKEFIRAVQEGPQSCMRWCDNGNGEYSGEPEEDSMDPEDEGYDRYTWGPHPYTAYDPKYGWSMILRKQGPKIVGRALLNMRSFVRSFAVPENGSYSESDHKIEAYLREQGYEKRQGWREGTKLAWVSADGFRPIIPYIDCSGDSRQRTLESCGTEYHFMSPYGDKQADCTTGGYTETEEHRYACEDCGDRFDEDDLTSVGEHLDSQVCQCCLEEYDYAHFYSNRHKYKAYFKESEVVEVDGNYYRIEDVEYFDIVLLENGEYCKDSEAVWVEGIGYYSDDDVGSDKDGNSLVVCCEDGEYRLREDCDYCEQNSDWYESDKCTKLSTGDHVLTDDLEEYLNQLTHEELVEAVADPVKFAEALISWEEENGAQDPREPEVTLELPLGATEEAILPCKENVCLTP